MARQHKHQLSGDEFGTQMDPPAERSLKDGPGDTAMRARVHAGQKRLAEVRAVLERRTITDEQRGLVPGVRADLAQVTETAVVELMVAKGVCSVDEFWSFYVAALEAEIQQGVDNCEHYYGFTP